jgi:CheY-like chemotaxis protein
MSQVIDNIVINANQAMPMGGHVYVTARNIPETEVEAQKLARRSYVRLSIRDTGVGMPPDILSNIFDPFFSTKQIGSGLGLTTCYSIIHRHEGHIEIDSSPGQGTTVEMYLPALPNRITSHPSPEGSLEKREGRLLVMDDEMMIRDYMTALCGSLGYDVVTEPDGEAAVRRFSVEHAGERPFNAVILDLTIPGGMGGKETLMAIRKLDPSVPVFVSSGYADDPVMAAPESHGFTGSICKPFRRNELDTLLVQFIS